MGESTYDAFESFPEAVSELDCDSSFISLTIESLESPLFSLFSLFASLASFALDVEDVVRTLVVDVVVVLWTDAAPVVVDVAVVSVDGWELDDVVTAGIVDADDVAAVVVEVLVDVVVLVAVIVVDDDVDVVDEDVVDVVDAVAELL